MAPRHFCPARALSRGLSLIEVLVGLAIGMLATVIIFQVFAASAERSSSTASGNDAQIAGTLALFHLERDIKVAGQGFGMIPASPGAGGVAGCTVAAYNNALAPADFSFALAAVQIVKGVDRTGVVGSPDQIVTLYGNSAYFVTGRQFNASTPTAKRLTRRDAFNLGDVVLLTNLGTNAATGVCALVEITGNSNIDGLTVDHVAGAAYTSFPSAAYPGGTARVASLNAGPSAATLVGPAGWAYNLGPAPSRNVWRVATAGAAGGSRLEWLNTLRSATPQSVSEGIVHLQAEYGVDDGGGAAGAAAVPAAVAGDGMISASEWTAAAPADWTRLLAVRFALLARSQQFEKAEVTRVAPTWGNGANAFTMFNVDGSADSSPGDPNDWRHYRYRVYESVVPLRNMIWGTAP